MKLEKNKHLSDSNLKGKSLLLNKRLHTTNLNSAQLDVHLLLWKIPLCDIISKTSYCQKFVNMPCFFLSLFFSRVYSQMTLVSTGLIITLYSNQIMTLHQR